MQDGTDVAFTVTPAHAHLLAEQLSPQPGEIQLIAGYVQEESARRVAAAAAAADGASAASGFTSDTAAAIEEQVVAGLAEVSMRRCMASAVIANTGTHGAHVAVQSVMPLQVEQFFYRLRHVRNMRERAEALAARMEFHEATAALQARVGVLHAASAELLHCTPLHNLLRRAREALDFAAAVASGSAPGAASSSSSAPFDMSRLAGMAALKSPANPKITLLHFLVTELEADSQLWAMLASCNTSSGTRAAGASATADAFSLAHVIAAAKHGGPLAVDKLSAELRLRERVLAKIAAFARPVAAEIGVVGTGAAAGGSGTSDTAPLRGPDDSLEAFLPTATAAMARLSDSLSAAAKQFTLAAAWLAQPATQDPAKLCGHIAAFVTALHALHSDELKKKAAGAAATKPRVPAPLVVKPASRAAASPLVAVTNTAASSPGPAVAAPKRADAPGEAPAPDGKSSRVAALLQRFGGGTSGGAL